MNRAPKGQKYRQKKRSTKSEPMADANSRTKPHVPTAAAMTEGFPEVSIPNIPHGLREASMGRAKIHKATTINTKTRYLKY